MKITINGKEIKDRKQKALISAIVFPLAGLIVVVIFGLLFTVTFVFIIPICLVIAALVGGVSLFFKGSTK